MIAAAFPLMQRQSNICTCCIGQLRSFCKVKPCLFCIEAVHLLNAFSDTFRLALRNAFRQRSRLALTLGLLAAGGAMFMTALNVSEAWDKNLKRIYVQRLYDQEIKLNDRINPDSVFQRNQITEWCYHS